MRPLKRVLDILTGRDLKKAALSTTQESPRLIRAKERLSRATDSFLTVFEEVVEERDNLRKKNAPPSS